MQADCKSFIADGYQMRNNGQKHRSDVTQSNERSQYSIVIGRALQGWLKLHDHDEMAPGQTFAPTPGPCTLCNVNDCEPLWMLLHSHGKLSAVAAKQRHSVLWLHVVGCNKAKLLCVLDSVWCLISNSCSLGVVVAGFARLNVADITPPDSLPEQLMHCRVFHQAPQCGPLLCAVHIGLMTG